MISFIPIFGKMNPGGEFLKVGPGKPELTSVIVWIQEILPL